MSWGHREAGRALSASPTPSLLPLSQLLLLFLTCEQNECGEKGPLSLGLVYTQGLGSHCPGRKPEGDGVGRNGDPTLTHPQASCSDNSETLKFHPRLHNLFL